MRFFAMHQVPDQPRLWLGPLRMAVLACMIGFALAPVSSFLEGCGQVAAVARIRFLNRVVSVTAAWTAMITHHGLYAPAFVLFG